MARQRFSRQLSSFEILLSIPLFIFLLLLPVTASSLERFDILTTEELHNMLQERKQHNIDFLLINGLDKMIYNHKAIPGSVSIPLGAFMNNRDKLGPDRQKLIVPY